MKIVIDIPESEYNRIMASSEVEYYELKIAQGTVLSEGQCDLISREALKEHIFTVNHGNGVEIEPIEVVPLCVIDNAPTVADRYDEGFRDGYAQCINDKEERKENNRLFQKGDKEE